MPNPAKESWQAALSLGAQEVLEMMAGTQLSPCGDGGRSACSELTAVVGLAGPVCGVLTVCCSQKGATLIASRMLGTSIEDAQRELLDAMGEICNMVAGNFKSKLGDAGQATLLSVPAVIKGTQYRICSAVKGEIIECQHEFDNEVILFRLEYKIAS
jgi:chemotaxis protein CheX